MIDIFEIMKTIPHRYPFLMVDRVDELIPGDRASGIKNVTINEPFFQGHFPGNPVMPGVMIIEAMAQLSGILAFQSGVKGNAVYFMSIEKAKFRKPVIPGNQLFLDIRVTQKRGNVWKFTGRALVDDTVVSEADFTAMVAQKEL
ncbi:MAG: 3-hydroxyacyl-ACP dehydratase FabZ [Nitrospirae bacterium]|nr:3-hydroxyacyl-ACP dehydratase FabZ [Nitrospirota bacterium]